MANILDENLRAFLEADATIVGIVGPRVAYNHVPQADEVPYIFFQQSGSSDDDGISDDAGPPTRFRYAIECWDDDPIVAKTLGRRVQAILNKYRGTFGDSTVQGIFAASQDDQYVPKAIPADQGFHGIFLDAEIVP